MAAPKTIGFVIGGETKRDGLPSVDGSTGKRGRFRAEAAAGTAKEEEEEKVERLLW